MPHNIDILVVDDDPLLRLGIVSMLQDLGYRAMAAQDPMRALHMLHKDLAVDLLITDYSMPGMTGVDLAHRIAQQRPGLLVLIMTGHQQLEDDLDPDWRQSYYISKWHLHLWCRRASRHLGSAPGLGIAGFSLDLRTFGRR
jgi:CheY-like chemotaxis protein